MTKYSRFTKEIIETKTASVLRAYEITSELLSKSDLSEDEEEYSQQSKYEMAVTLLDLVLKSNLNGDADDFHNYSLTFVEIEYFDHALRILEAGLRRYELNTDLLADYLKYLPSSSTENWREKCNEIYSKLIATPKRSWTWRAYHFSIEYLLKLLENVDADGKKIKTECLDLVREFKLAFPNDERPYLAEASIRLTFKEETLALKTWQRAIDKEGLRCPRCAISIAEKAFDRKEYEKALEYLIRAEKDSIELRGSFDLAYIYYCRLLAQISKYIIETHGDNNFESIEGHTALVEDIFSNYRLLKKLWKNRKDKINDIARYIDLIKLRSKINEELDDE